jgi:predicted amidohydrolase YtcJ
VPVASIDPREGLFAALERRSAAGGPAGGWRPEEKLSFDEAVRAYTVAAAHAAGRNRSGTLAPGRDADLVAWAFDPAVERGAGDAVRAGSARLTVVGGEVVMRR